jgi:hypothetical protein
VTFQLSETSEEGTERVTGGPRHLSKNLNPHFPARYAVHDENRYLFFLFQFRVNVAQSRGRERGSEEGGREEGRGKG